MTQRAQRAWAAALRRAALPSCVLAVNPVDINRLCAAYMPWPAAAHIGRAYDRWLRRTLTATVARRIVARATGGRR